MTDLSHFRLRRYLTLREAAYLAVGVDPHGIVENVRAKEVWARLRDAANNTFRDVASSRGELLEPKVEVKLLRCAELDPEDEEMPPYPMTLALGELTDQLKRRLESDPDRVLFRTEVIGRWFDLNGNGFVPAFSFRPAGDGSHMPQRGHAEHDLHPRERTCLLNTVAALLELVLNPRHGRTSQAAVIEELIANYSDKPGIKKSTLEARFAEAKRSIEQN